jgi:hypothetical protein
MIKRVYLCSCKVKVKGKPDPLQAWSDPEGTRKLRFPDFMTTAQDSGKVVSLTHRPHLPPGNTPGTHFCWRLSRSQGYSAIRRIYMDLGSNQRPSDFQCITLTTVLPQSTFINYTFLLSDFNNTWIFSVFFFRKSTNKKIHKNPSSGSRVFPCGRTDRHDEVNSRSS